MAIRNVGKADRVVRLLLAGFVLWSGLVLLDGLKGNILGILVCSLSTIPFYMALKGSCFVLAFFKKHTLDIQECKLYGHPYQEKKNKDEQ